MAQAGFFFVLKNQRNAEKATKVVTMQRIPALPRQQLPVGVAAKEVCANDKVKVVGVKHLAVLRNVFMAHTYHHI